MIREHLLAKIKSFNGAADLIRMFLGNRDPNGECFTYTYGTGEEITWDIEKAKKIQTNFEGECDRELLKYITETYDYDHDKVDKVDCSIPGIAVPIKIPGHWKAEIILIDGIHRAVKAYKNNFTFRAKILTPDQSLSCIIAFTPGILLEIDGKHDWLERI